MYKDLQPTQDHWKTYKQIQTHEKTMKGITAEISTGSHMITNNKDIIRNKYNSYTLIY